MAIVTLAEVGTLRRKKGYEVRASIADSGQGPRVDLREYVTAEAHPAMSAGTEADREAWARRKGVKARSAYVGPTKAGFWLTPGQALELSELLYSASTAAVRDFGADPDGDPDQPNVANVSTAA
jgi:hypothetical protein